MPLKTPQSRSIDASWLNHRFKLAGMQQVEDTFSKAADTCALKVIGEA